MESQWAGAERRYAMAGRNKQVRTEIKALSNHETWPLFPLGSFLFPFDSTPLDRSQHQPACHGSNQPVVTAECSLSMTDLAQQDVSRLHSLHHESWKPSTAGITPAAKKCCSFACGCVDEGPNMCYEGAVIQQGDGVDYCVVELMS